MFFVKTEDLKIGMRMARPIFTKDGALLFDRDSKLSEASLNNVKNFGLLGLYVLEPAEPVPPMTEEEIEFERFQTMTYYAIQKELEALISTKKTSKLDQIVNSISKSYGHQNKKIHFIQGLRSNDDYLYKHVLNTSILSALIGHKLNAKIEDRNLAMTCAIFYDLTHLFIPKDAKLDQKPEEERNAILRIATTKGLDFIKEIFISTPMYHRVCNQVHQLRQAQINGIPLEGKTTLAASIIFIAATFDQMTAMSSWSEPVSDLVALKYMLDRPQYYDPAIVQALVGTLSILTSGISVVLNTGESALVISENETNFLRPTLLCYRDNATIDLSDANRYGHLQIVDILQKMDNRHIMT